MRILYIAYYTTLRNFRDYKSLAFTLLLPIMLILILGSALGGVFTPSDISATTICYLDEDGEFMAQAFEEFLSDEEISKLLQYKTVASKEEAFDLIKAREASALVIFPEQLSKSIQGQVANKISIEVYNSKYSSFRESILQSMLNSFVSGTNAHLVLRYMGETSQGYRMFNSLQETAVTAEGNAPRAIDYYSVTMLVMTIMFGTSYGNWALKEEKQRNTSIRLASAPIGYHEVVLGKLLGTVVTVLLQAILIVAFTKLAFDVNWGGNLWFILFICFSASLMSVGLGMMVSNLGKNPQATAGLLTFLVNISTFLAGGYFPSSQMGPALLKLGVISPNYQAQQAMFNTIYGGSTAQTTNAVLAIWIIAAVSFVIAGLTERRSAN